MSLDAKPIYLFYQLIFCLVILRLPFHLRRPRPAMFIIPSVSVCTHSVPAAAAAEKERSKIITTGSQMFSISLALVNKAKQHLSQVDLITQSFLVR